MRSGACWFECLRSAKVCASGQPANRLRCGLPISLPGPTDGRTKSAGDQPIGKRAVALMPMILEPGGMNGISTEMPPINFMMLSTDHPSEPRKIAFGMVRMGTVLAVSLGMIDT